MTRKQVIILSVLAVAVVIAGVVGIIMSFTKKSTTTSSTPQGTTTTDPVSGETVTKDSSLYQKTDDADTSDRPIILGINKLNDYGLSAEQVDKVYNALYTFSINQTPKIKNISFYKDSYQPTLQDDTGVAHMKVKMQASGKDDYYLDIAYSGASNATTKVYASDQKTLLFTQ